MSHTEGFNPYRFGVIGSSDGHNASAPVEEINYHGKLPLLDGSAACAWAGLLIIPPRCRAGGAGVPPGWRRYGPRKTPASPCTTPCVARRPTPPRARASAVRFFGGWSYPAEPATKQDDWIARRKTAASPWGGFCPRTIAAAPELCCLGHPRPAQRQSGQDTDHQGLGRQQRPIP